MKDVINQFVSLFTVDKTKEGESNKFIIVIRVLEFILFVYSIINATFSFVNGYYAAFTSFLMSGIAFLGVLHLSYRVSVKKQIIGVNIVAFISVVYGYWLFGSDALIQNFFIVLVVLAFFSGYGYYRNKFIYVAFLLLVYIVMEIWGGNFRPDIPLPQAGIHFFKVMDIITSFVCASVICYVYSKDSQHLEGKLMEYNNLLKKQASTDPLTGLCNRRSAIEMINGLIAKPSGKGFCVCMCDIDFFKKVNDSYGHDIGDNVLRGVASTMLEGFPQNCMISRWGGEEFLVIFPEMNGDDAKMLLDIMRAKLKKMEYRAGEKRFGVTLTFGLAEYGYNGDSEALVKEADEKLYYGKEHGRDQVVY